MPRFILRLYRGAGDTPPVTLAVTSDLFIAAAADAAITSGQGSELYVEAAASSALASGIASDAVLEALATAAVAGASSVELFIDADSITRVSSEGVSELVLEASATLEVLSPPLTGGRPARRRAWRPAIPLRPRRRVLRPKPALAAVELDVAGELVLEASADVRMYGDPAEREQVALLELALL